MSGSQLVIRRRSQRVRIGVERVLLGWGMALSLFVMDLWVRRTIRRSAGEQRSAPS